MDNPKCFESRIEEGLFAVIIFACCLAQLMRETLEVDNLKNDKILLENTLPGWYTPSI